MLAIRETVLGPEHPDVVASLDGLAQLYQSIGVYSAAKPLLQRAVTINEKTLGPEDLRTAIFLDKLASLYERIGLYSKAEPLCQRALAIFEEILGPEHPYTAQSLTNLAVLHYRTASFGKVEQLFQRALAIREAAVGPEHPDTVISLNNLGVTYTAKGEYSKAAPFFERALVITEKLMGLEHPGVLDSLNNLTLPYHASVAYPRAEPMYQRALAIKEAALGPEHPATVASLGNLARVYDIAGAGAKAEPLYRRAIAITERTLGPDHPDTALLLYRLAELHRATHAFAEAEPFYQRAIAINDKAFGVNHPLTANFVNGLAELYRANGTYANAEPLYQRAIDIQDKGRGPAHPLTANSLNGLAELYRTTGAYAKAEPLLRRAIAISEKALGPEHQATAFSLSLLARLYDATGAYTQAESMYEQAQAIEENVIRRFFLGSSEARKLRFLGPQISTNELISISLTHPTPRRVALGLTSGLRNKGRVLAAMSDSIAQLRRAATAKDRALLEQLSAVAQELSSLTFRGPGTLSVQDYHERLNRLAQQQDALQAQLSSRSAELARGPTQISVEAVRLALPADTVLLEWFRYRPMDRAAKSASRFLAPRYVAYVLKRTGDPVALDIGDAEHIEDLIAKFRSALTDLTIGSRRSSQTASGRASLRNLAAEISEELFEPLKPYVAGSQRLLISPDGALNLLPFAALLDERGDYLAQHFEISYLTSGRDLLQIGGHAPAYSPPVVLAAPNYGEHRGEQWFGQEPQRSAHSAELRRRALTFDPLSGANAEAKIVQALLDLRPDQALIGDRATEAQLRSLHGPRILHLATHGFFLGEDDLPPMLRRSIEWDARAPSALKGNPFLRSGLALSGANERRSGDLDDGILTAGEVAHLDLMGTQLVVLSGCETALGTVGAGEGMFGLRRALVLAGAQSQLVSLWETGDAATQELMADYYRRLLNGEGRSAALRSVQLSMLADPARQHPYYWAAFIPIGDWTPLKEQARPVEPGLEQAVGGSMK